MNARCGVGARRMRRTGAVAGIVLGTVALLTGCDATKKQAAAPSGSTSATGSTPTAPGTKPGLGGCTVAAAGDIAGDDFQTGAARTAALITAAKPRAVIAVGDTAYNSGTPEDYARYYNPTWGAFKKKTLPVPGNHEYNEKNGAGYRGYFGNAAAENRGVDVCGWRVLLVNEYQGMSEAAAFITSDAARHPRVPLIVVWHQPRYSSGSEHGSDKDVQPLWAASVNAGASLVLNGHDHDYERFDELDTLGGPTSAGTREFVTGLGGHHIRTFNTILSTSQAHFTGVPAVLFLTLRANGYSWSEQTADHKVVDRGTAQVRRR